MALRVLVQAGHVAPRESGIPGVGTIQEQELALTLQKALGLLLDRDPRFQPIPVPGDIPDGIRVDAALFLHGDGSRNTSVSGYCFGYPDQPANRRLADLIAAEIEKIPGHPPRRRDNYTRDLAGYYGFRKVDTLGPEVVIEHGFLTNPAERRWLFANASRLARAEYVALCRYFGRDPLDDTDNQRRRAATRAWILAQRQAGRTWKWIKTTPNWREFRRRGGT